MDKGADQELYDLLHENSEQIIDKVEQFATAYGMLLKEDGIILSNSLQSLEGNPFEQARAKLRSQLINIAVCGAFSSGKSFLISSLINHINWHPESTSKDIFEGQEIDRYATLLPTSPQQTNSCPLAIIPWPSGRRFQVMFEDKKTWEDKCYPSASDEQVSRKILAYATDIEEGRALRALQDRDRNVIRARLLLSSMPLPAIIYDLPGIGAIGEEHIQAVHEALRLADCIVYVASAIKELTDAEFALLRFVQDIAEQGKTPIFFVLTQIDREPDWEKVLDKDNQFLSVCFKTSENLQDLIGEGFMPISVAAEAKAHGMFQAGKLTAEERDKALEKSGMPAFRKKLTDHLTQYSGPAHLREIIAQMYAVLKDLRAHVDSRIQAETLPLQEADTRIRESRTLVRALAEKSMVLSDDLDKLGRATLDAALAYSNPDDLLALFQEQVVPVITKADVTKDSERDKIQMAIKDVRDGWLQREEVGFTPSWNRAWDYYKKQSLILLQQRVSQAAQEAAVTFPVVVGEEFAPDLEKDAMRVKDKLLAVRMAQQISVGVTGLGIGGIAAGALAFGSAAFAVAPVALFLIGVGAAGVGLTTFRKKKDLARLRTPLIDYLTKYCDQVMTHLELQAERIIARQKNEILGLVGQLISVQKDNITALEIRLKTGDLRAQQDQVKLLKDLTAECNNIEQLIMDPRHWPSDATVTPAPAEGTLPDGESQGGPGIDDENGEGIGTS